MTVLESARALVVAEEILHAAADVACAAHAACVNAARRNIGYADLVSALNAADAAYQVALDAADAAYQSLVREWETSRSE